MQQRGAQWITFGTEQVQHRLEASGRRSTLNTTNRLLLLLLLLRGSQEEVAQTDAGGSGERDIPGAVPLKGTLEATPKDRTRTEAGLLLRRFTTQRHHVVAQRGARCKV